MPLPLLFIGAAAATGMFGAGKTVKAISDNSKAGNLIKVANQEVEEAKEKLEAKRTELDAQIEVYLKELGIVE